MIVMLLLSMTVQVNAVQGTLDETIALIANYLEQQQRKAGIPTEFGSWPDEQWATGSLGLGMAAAYAKMGVLEYQHAAIRAAMHIQMNSIMSLSGDGAHALVRIQEITPEHHWLEMTDRFYSLVKLDGTANYMAEYADYDPSMAVFYLAHHVEAAYALDIPDKDIWRQGLIDRLATVDNSSHFPVMALALATWALVDTGPLDDTLIDPEATEASYWLGRTLNGLPRLLMDHRVPVGQEDAGSFYWKFDHRGGPEDAIIRSGYTEDCVFGVLAFQAVSNRCLALAAGEDMSATCGTVSPAELEAAIADLTAILINAVQPDGSVCAHVSLGAQEYYTFAGETLYALCQVGQDSSQLSP